MKSRLKRTLRPFLDVLSISNFYSSRLRALRHYRKFQSQYDDFNASGGVITHNYPILTEYDDQAGSASGHYFHQDLLVASLIFANNPERHIDIGSRIDGFVAHVASFRKIEVMDLRALKDPGHDNISFLQADLMSDDSAKENSTDSLSCLHAIEHFGLGRYGDDIDPEGHKHGFSNMLKMLRPGGIFYISFPIGRQNEVHFNAHRVFHPADVFTWSPACANLKLERFDYVDDGGALHRDSKVDLADLDLGFGCGIYSFRKLH